MMLFSCLGKWPKIKVFRKSVFTGLLASIIIFPSCIPHRKLVYLQHQAETADTIPYTFTDYIIRPGDILHIQVITLDEKSAELFNTDRNQQRTTLGGGIGSMYMYLQGYNVDDRGKVIIPVVGEVDVAGKTINQVSGHISEKVAEYLIGATVSVKLVNFSVTVIGEVRNPGKYYIYDNRISIIDILASAGDLTDFGNRNITVVRQTNEGATIGTINVGDAQAIRSEYFFLQPGDIVYAEPYKLKRLGISQFPFSLVISSVSFALFLITYIGNNR